ncbi:MAG: DHA2 family efflux MFS transporter permease subunit [Actinobacteria bacterium]|nr:DHA2 family efflux MFS transporter permease subunit [Actinomycetota bacterium]
MASTATRNPWLVLFSTSLAVFAVFLDTTILFVAFPSITDAFDGVDPSTLSWVLNAYTIVFAALLIPAGRLADRIGRRRTFLAAVVGFTLASMLCGIAPTAQLLIVARVLQAGSAAALVPASLALVLQTFPREKIPVAVAVWGAVGAVAGAAGPTLGALTVEHLGWRWAFFINLPVGIVSLALGRRVLPEGRESNPGPLPDPFGVFVLAAGLAACAYGIVQTDEWGWASPRFIATEVVAAALLTWFVHRSARVAHPVLDLKLFSSRSFSTANLALLAFAIGFNAMFLGNVLFLTQVWGYSILRAGMGIAVGPLTVAVLAPLFGRLAARVGQRRLLIPGGLIWGAGGVLLIARATTTPEYASVYLPNIILTGIGVALCLPQLSSAAVQGLPPDEFGSGSAVSQAVRNLGATLGVALVIALTAGATPESALDHFHSVWWLLAGCGVVVTAVSLTLPKRRSAAVALPAEAAVAHA